MTETPSTPVDEQAEIEPVKTEPAEESGAEIMPVEAAPEPAEPQLEASGELEELSAAEILDAELARLLTTPAGVQGGIEAVLFASPEPLSPRKIGRVLGIGDLKIVQAIIAQLQAQYDADNRGMQIIETAGGYQMATREVFADLVLRLRGRKRRPSLSPAALETLAIVAYRQPIIRAEIEAVRGVESSGMLRNLMDMGLVEIVGRKDVLGRPAMYGTSEAFLQSFGLKTLAELPPIAELKRRLAEQAEEDEKAEAAAELSAVPVDPAPPAADSAPAEPEESTTESETNMKEPMDQEPLEDNEPLEDDAIENGDEDEVFEDDDDDDAFDEDDLEFDEADEDFDDEDEDDLDEDDEEDLEDDLDDDEDRPKE